MRRLAQSVLLLTAVYWVPVATSAAVDPFDESGGALAPPVSYVVGAQPYAVALADIDGDSLPDAAVGNEGSDEVAVLRGTPGGGFGAATFYPAGDGAQGVALGDLDGDGKRDLVAVNLWDSTVSIRLGGGDGTFGSLQTRAVGMNPHALVVTDLDGDGDHDIATANGSGGISVLINLGGAQFAAKVDYLAGINPRDITAADFNKDGKVDLAVTNEGGASVSVLLGHGNGTYQAATHFAVGPQPQSIAAGDLNGDGSLDLVVPSAGANSIALLIGNGKGSFSRGTDVPTSGVPTSSRPIDLDQDGHLDLLVCAGFDQVQVYRGNGTAQFSVRSIFAAVAGARAPVTADLNGDNRPDVVAVGVQAGAMAVLLNTSSQPLQIARSSAAHAGTSYELRKSELWFNRQTSNQYPAVYPFSHVGYADIDKDGDTDLLQTFSDNDRLFPVKVLRNTGQGQFADVTAAVITGPQLGTTTTRKVISGDYNLDGWADFFVLGHGVDAPPFPGEPPRLFLSNGAGKLADVENALFLTGFNHAGASADIDGNGSIDILVGRTGAPFLLLNNGQAQFTLDTVRLPPDISFISSEFADIDQDGYIDLLVDGYEPDGVPTRIYWGRSNGLYRAASSFTIPPVPHWGVILDFAIEDIDGDGRRDVIVNRTGSTDIYEGRYLQILRNSADRTFVDETATRIILNQDLRPFDFLRAQDFDADGDVDLFVDDRNDVASGEYAWANDGAGVFSPYGGTVTPRVNTAEVEPGHSGAFFNPVRNGEGNYVEVLDDDSALVYTFTYRPDGSGPAWFIGLGDIAGDTIEIYDLLRPTGTEFGSGFDGDEIDFDAIGRMSMRFPDCGASGNGGSVVYSGEPALGYEELRSRAKRLSHITGCGGQPASANAGLSGSYYDPARNGEGLVVEWLTSGEVLVVFFTYDPEGDQFWMLGIDAPTGKGVTMEALYPATSTSWGSAFDAEEVELETWGTFKLTWTSCDALTFEYVSALPGFGSAVRNYTRLTRLAGTSCPVFP
ncbi:MAG: VCBS repeat-containing protein [Pirellulaceae bacterium]|nr:VCBS repeat-containing protein [Pirellulaceae bacterium]